MTFKCFCHRHGDVERRVAAKCFPHASTEPQQAAAAPSVVRRWTMRLISYL